MIEAPTRSSCVSLLPMRRGRRLEFWLGLPRICLNPCPVCRGSHMWWPEAIFIGGLGRGHEVRGLTVGGYEMDGMGLVLGWNCDLDDRYPARFSLDGLVGVGV